MSNETMNINLKLGVIGGSGLYEIAGLKGGHWVAGYSSFGEPSDQFYCGNLHGIEVVFLPRHGRGHIIPPDAINYRANIDAMKRLGVTDILSLSACGSFKEDLAPGTFVIVDQFIDRTYGRASSFFGTGLVAHVSMAHPTCGRLGERVFEVAQTLGLMVQMGGTYITMQGPQFSTLGESLAYKEMGADVIGMTNMPEAKLAREAEICYQTIGMVTDFDCWHPDHDHVEVSSIIKVLKGNAKSAQDLVANMAKALSAPRDLCEKGCDRALEFAVITDPKMQDKKMREKLKGVAGRIFV